MEGDGRNFSSMYNGDHNEYKICNTIYDKWFETISEELRSNVNVLQDIIEVRGEVKACESIGMYDILFIIDI